MFASTMFHRSVKLATNGLQASYITSTSNRCEKLAGKIAIVTGSTDGIGLATATRLARDGATVVISSRREVNVNRTVQQLKNEGLSVWGIPCHVGISADRDALITETVKKYGGIDILVSNAAANVAFGSILDCSESNWDQTFEINVKAPFLLSKAVVPVMQKRNGGSIIYISSVAAYQPFTEIGAYAVSKTALLGLTKALANQCAKDNIRVNCVAPGLIQTGFSTALVENEKIYKKFIGLIPMRRIGKPSDIEGIVEYLASEDASYMTGETIVVAGGASSRL